MTERLGATVQRPAIADEPFAERTVIVDWPHRIRKCCVFLIQISISLIFLMLAGAILHPYEAKPKL